MVVVCNAVRLYDRRMHASRLPGQTSSGSSWPMWVSCYIPATFKAGNADHPSTRCGCKQLLSAWYLVAPVVRCRIAIGHAPAVSTCFDMLHVSVTGAACSCTRSYGDTGQLLGANVAFAEQPDMQQQINRQSETAMHALFARLMFDLLA